MFTLIIACIRIIIINLVLHRAVNVFIVKNRECRMLTLAKIEEYGHKAVTSMGEGKKKKSIFCLLKINIKVKGIIIFNFLSL